MKNKAKLFGIYLPIFLILLPATVALRTIACLKDYDGWYFSDKLLINIANVALVAGVIFFLTYIWTARKDISLVPSFSSAAHYIPGGVVSVALVFVAVELFITAKDKFAVIDPLSSNRVYQIVMAVLTLAASLLALAAISYFVSSSINPKRRSVRHSDFAIITTVFFCIYVAMMYFDTIVPINSPIRITDQMAFLASTLFFLYEARLSLGRERWRHYVAYGFIASLLTAYSSIPSLIYYFVNGHTLTPRSALGDLCLYDAVLLFAIFIFITAKLLLTGMLVPDRTSPLVEKIIESADARAAELATLNAVEEEEIAESAEEARADGERAEVTDIDDDVVQESFFSDDGTDDDNTKEEVNE